MGTVFALSVGVILNHIHERVEPVLLALTLWLTACHERDAAAIDTTPVRASAEASAPHLASPSEARESGAPHAPHFASPSEVRESGAPHAPHFASTKSASVGADVLRLTLDNGLRVVIVPSTLAPVVASVVNYEVGSNEAPIGFPGTAHALEHMMFRGSPGLSSDQLAAIGAALGGSFNADTAQTLTQYFFTVPSSDVDTVLEIEAHRMAGLLATPAGWSLERGAIEQEVARDLSDPEYVLYTRLLGSLFQHTPYAHDALGTRPSFDATSAAMLRSFHEHWYAPNNAVLVVAGDVDPVATAARVKAVFGGLAERTLPKRPTVRFEPVEPRTFRMPSDRPLGLALLAFRLPGYRDADYAASKVLSDVLDSHRGEIYGLAAKGKVIDAGFTLDTSPASAIGYAWAEVAPGTDPTAAADLLKQAIAKVVDNGADADLVQAARLRARTDAELQKNSVLGLAMAWSQAIALEGRASPEDDVRAIQKVDAADVDAVARRYLDASRAVVGLLTPAKPGSAAKPKPSAAASGEGPLAPKAPAHAVELPAWARKVSERLEVPRSTLHPVVTRLDNGLELIVQPETVSHTVSIYGRVHNEPALETPPGRQGVDRVVDQLLDYGTDQLDRVAFQKALDEIGAYESSGTDFSLQVPSDQFERGVALLAQNEIHPALPQAGFDVVRAQVAEQVRGERASPAYRADLALRTSLYPKGDPLLRDPTPQSVTALTRADATAYHRKVFRPDLTTIVVVGDITAQRAQTLIERAFGQWRAQGPPPDTLLPTVGTNRAATVRIPDPSRVQDEVTLAEVVEVRRKDPDYYALQLGNHVLGGGFYASRLYRDLREQAGLVYHVDSELDVRRTRGLYLVHYGCDPDNTAQVRTRIEQALSQLQRTLVEPHALRQAKALLLREIPLDEASEEDIAHGFIHRVTLELPLDEPTRAAQRYMALGPDDIRKVFEREIRPHGLVEIVRGP